LGPHGGFQVEEEEKNGKIKIKKIRKKFRCEYCFWIFIKAFNPIPISNFLTNLGTYLKTNLGD
jgi:hypothetical protein